MPSEVLKIAVYANPVSGRGKALGAAQAFSKALGKSRRQADIFETTPEGDVFSTPPADDVSARIVFGGDGTFNQLLNSAHDEAIPLGFFGCGTMDVLARALTLPRKIEEFARLVESGATLEIPVLLVNGWKALIFYEAGFMARIVCLVNEWRRESKKRGRAEFVHRGISAIFKERARRLFIELPERTLGPYSNVLVARAKQYGGIMALPIPAPSSEYLKRREFTIIGCTARNLATRLMYALATALRLLPLLSRLGRFGKFLGRFEVIQASAATITCYKRPRPYQRKEPETLDEPSAYVDAETLERPYPHHLSFDERPVRIIGI